MPPTTYAPGHVVAGRYRIEAVLGEGSTAEVYLADDFSLHRTVVVKVLRPELAAHEEIRRAFRDQIIRAATLGHPHLARVFDGGQEAGSIFMVTEYLGGGSLEEVLTAGERLSVDDAAKLGRDVASALAHLHAHGIVHGQLSPRKLLFDEEGRVKVSDVALVRLRTMLRRRYSFNDTRYLSPEQVQGRPAEAKSDVYSLALIVYEAATGQSPYDAATAEDLARVRLTTPLPVRPELGTLDMALAQASVPDPILRLDAEQAAHRFGSTTADPSPLIIAPIGAAPLLAQYPPVEPRASIGFRAPSADEITGPAAHFPSPQVPRRGEGAPPRPSLPTYPVVPPPRRRRMALLVTAAVLLVAAVGGAAAWRLGLLSASHTVPTLSGLDVQQASSLLANDGFTLKVSSHQNSATVPSGGIISQQPGAGTSSKSGLVVNVTVSDGPVMVVLPAVLGQNCVAATAALLKVKIGAQCPASASIASTRPVGEVAEVLYHGEANPTSVPAGAAVILALSAGPNATTTTTTPGATTTTTTPGATTTTTSPTTTTSTTPPPGQGPRPVPNVIGMGPAAVNAAFKKAVLFYTTRGPNAGTNKWTTVVSEIPAPGTMAPWRSTIILNVK